MKIHVEHELCMGHGMCVARAPQVYRLNDEGFNDMPDTDVEPGHETAATRGAFACPERAITVAGDTGA